jgi:hypothetical protein
MKNRRNKERTQKNSKKTIQENFSVRVHKAILAARCPDFATKVLGQHFDVNEVQLSKREEKNEPKYFS